MTMNMMGNPKGECSHATSQGPGTQAGTNEQGGCKILKCPSSWRSLRARNVRSGKYCPEFAFPDHCSGRIGSPWQGCPEDSVPRTPKEQSSP